MTTQTKIYYPSRPKLALIFLGGVALTATSLWILLDDSGDPSLKVRIAGWIGAPFFGVLSVYLLVRLIQRRPSVVIDADGIHDNASMASAGFIRWSDIASATIFSVKNQKMVGILLKDNDRFLSRFGMIRRALAKANISMGYPLVAIPETAVSVKAEQLHEEITQALRANAS